MTAPRLLKKREIHIAPYLFNMSRGPLWLDEGLTYEERERA